MWHGRVYIRIRSLGREIHVVDAQLIVKPMSFCLDKLRGKEALGLDLVHDPVFELVA
jgi:hypothetical protein